MKSKIKNCFLIGAFVILCVFGISVKKSFAAPPIVTVGNITVSGATGTDGVFITHNAQAGGKSDNMVVEWDNSSLGDNNSGTVNVTVDFSQLGGTANVQAFDDGGMSDDSLDAYANDGIWTATYSLGRGTLDGEIGKVSVSVTSGNEITVRLDDTDIVIDNVPPVVITTVDTYGTNASAFSFGGVTSNGSKVYYEIRDVDDTIVTADYIGQVADGAGNYNISGINLSGMANGRVYLYVWVQDYAGNYSASFYDSKDFIKTAGIIGIDKSSLTAAIDNAYSDAPIREIYSLTAASYTSESWSNYINAINAAIVIENDANATPTEIADAAFAIENSDANLVLLASIVAAPMANPVAGTYTSAQSLTLSTSTSGALIYYTTNGDTPTVSSILYSGAITIPSSQTIKAIAVKSGNLNSSIFSASYIINIPVVISSSSSHKSEKKSTPARTITNSKKTVKMGEVLTQRGKKFSKNSFVLLYATRQNGTYYPPLKIKTSSTGSFVTTYRVNKPRGTYKWYVVDSKTGKKSKTVSYKVK